MPNVQFPFTDLTDKIQLHLLNTLLEDILEEQDFSETTGTIRAWVNFNGDNDPPTIRANFNVSSIGDGGTGIFQVVWANAFADGNYAVVAGVVEQGVTREGRFVNLTSVSEPTTTSATVVIADGGTATTQVDEGVITVIAIGTGTT